MKAKGSFFLHSGKLVCIFLSISILGIFGCPRLSQAELQMSQQSPEALGTAVVKAYKIQDMKAFTELAISYKQLKNLMANVKLPSSARREAIHKLGASGYKHQIQDSLGKVLGSSAIAWEKAQFQKFVPSRNPVEIAPGYKMLIGKMRIQAGEKIYAQPVTFVEIGKGQFFIGDFGPFEITQ